MLVLITTGVVACAACGSAAIFRWGIWWRFMVWTVVSAWFSGYHCGRNMGFTRDLPSCTEGTVSDPSRRLMLMFCCDFHLLNLLLNVISVPIIRHGLWWSCKHLKI